MSIGLVTIAVFFKFIDNNRKIMQYFNTFEWLTNTTSAAVSPQSKQSGSHTCTPYKNMANPTHFTTPGQWLQIHVHTYTNTHTHTHINNTFILYPYISLYTHIKSKCTNIKLRVELSQYFVWIISFVQIYIHTWPWPWISSFNDLNLFFYLLSHLAGFGFRNPLKTQKCKRTNTKHHGILLQRDVNHTETRKIKSSLTFQPYKQGFDL